MMVIVELILGGSDYVIARWKWAPATNRIELVAALIGGFIGMAIGFWSWKAICLRTGFLSPTQMEALYKPE